MGVEKLEDKIIKENITLYPDTIAPILYRILLLNFEASSPFGIGILFSKDFD
jgi:hypothetical protein